MINIDYLNESVADVLGDTLPDSIILQEGLENGTEEDLVVYKFSQWTQIGSADEHYTDNTSSESYTTEALYRTCLNIIGVGNYADQRLLAVKHNLNKEWFRDQFKEIGLYYLHSGEMKYAPKRVNTGWESRYILEIYFNIRVTDTDNIPYIDTVEIETEVKNETDQIVIDRTDTIDIYP